MEKTVTYLEDKRREREAMLEKQEQKVRESCACVRCNKSMTIHLAMDVLHAVTCPHCRYQFALTIESGRGAA